MFIFHDLKMIYICIPKTGSTSFLQAIEKKHRFKFASSSHRSNHFIKHSKAKDVRDNFIKESIWSTYHKIGFIRHPYDWIRSIYQLNNQLLGEDNTKPFPLYVKDFSLTMFDWFTDGEELIIDEIYRLEDFREIMKQYGANGKLHLNRTSPKKTTDITEDLKQIIDKKFAREMTYYEV